MPLIFSNLNKNNLNMESPENINQAEYDNLKRYHKAISYNNDELMDMVNLSRRFVNKNTPSCLTCHSSMRDTKTALMSWFLYNETRIKTNLDAQIVAQAKEQVSSYSKCECKGKCKCKK
jgi:hypothetical protein